MKNTLVKYKTQENLFNTLTREIWNDMFIDPFFGLSRNWRPEYIKNEDNQITLEIELPRVKASEIKVTSEDNNTIKITANNDKVIYNRLFRLDGIDGDKSTVKLENGVLTVTIPKLVSESKVKNLEVKEVKS